MRLSTTTDAASASSKVGGSVSTWITRDSHTDVVSCLLELARTSQPATVAGTAKAVRSAQEGSLKRATVMHGAGDVRVEEVPDPTIQEPTDAVVRVVRSGVCGSDLWAYGSMPASEQGWPMGHEFLGLMEDLGAEVSGLKRRDLVVTPGSARRSATCSPQWVIADNATLADGIATAALLTDPPRLNETHRFTFVRMSANGIEASPAFEGWLYDQACDASAEVSGEAGSQGSR